MDYSSSLSEAMLAGLCEIMNSPHYTSTPIGRDVTSRELYDKVGSILERIKNTEKYISASWKILDGPTSLLGSELIGICNSVRSISSVHNNKTEWAFEVSGYSAFDVSKNKKMLQAKVIPEDVAFLCMLGIMIGDDIDQFQETTDCSEAVDKLMKLKEKLSLRSKVEGETTDTSLSRIIICFPEVVAIIYEKIPDIPGAITNDAISEMTGFADYPPMAKAPGLACMLPKDIPETQEILNALFYPNMKLLEIVNKNNETWQNTSKKTRASQSKVYLLDALDSPLFQETKREDWCKKLNIIASGKYTPAWVNAAKVAKKLLDEEYGVSF